MTLTDPRQNSLIDEFLKLVERQFFIQKKANVVTREKKQA